eukprot:1616799-Amphidinium_carterae.1
MGKPTPFLAEVKHLFLARQVTVETWFLERPSKVEGKMMQHQTRDEKMQVLGNRLHGPFAPERKI